MLTNIAVDKCSRWTFLVILLVCRGLLGWVLAHFDGITLDAEQRKSSRRRRCDNLGVTAQVRMCVERI